MKKILLAIVGVVYILIGIAGIILPIVPGWVLIFLGLSFIAPKLAERLKRRILRKFAKHEILYLEKFRKLKVHAGFTTRHFSLVFKKTDDFLEADNRLHFPKLLAQSPVAIHHGMKPITRFAFLNQVHGGAVAVLEDPSVIGENEFYHVQKTDGVITNIKELALLVMTADCLSVFFAAGKPASWIGVVHAGWRGTQEEISKKAFKLIREKAGCRAKDIRIILGPCIGKKQYEVGPEFKKIFSKKFVKERKGKLTFDLAGENKRQLMKAGALERNIYEIDMCTIEENGDLYSFRKEKDAAGRMVSFIVLQG